MHTTPKITDLLQAGYPPPPGQLTTKPWRSHSTSPNAAQANNDPPTTRLWAPFRYRIHLRRLPGCGCALALLISAGFYALVALAIWLLS